MRVVPVVLLLAIVVSSCSDEMDCGLNGQCDVASSACVCRSPWTGPQCSTLSLAPAPLSGGYREQDPDTGDYTVSTWGGSVIADPDKEGEYVMFFSRMNNHCGLRTWTKNSEVWSARSTIGLLGPYDWKTAKRILPAFSHGPRIARANDGTFLLYHIGCGKPRGTQMMCINGTTPQVPLFEIEDDVYSSSSCTSNWVGLMTSDNLDGPWTRFGSGPIITGDKAGTWDAGLTNPSPLMLKNGSVLLMWRSSVKPERLGIATAPSWKGPYEKRDSDPLVADPNEDPFIWEDEFGNFHGLTHHMVDGQGVKGGGKHVWSQDGLSWRVSDDLAYTTQIEFEDGPIQQVQRRERPVLYFENNTPVALFTGLQPGSTDDYCYTHVSPVLSQNTE
jgi:hypothetical protein